MYADRLFTALERNEPAPGQLLVAAPGMLSPEFARSVILLIEHNENFTFGVNLTVRSETAVFNVLPEWHPYCAKPQALYIGGPMGQQNAVALAKTKQGVDIDSTPRLHRLAPRLAHVDLGEGPEGVAEYVDSVRFFVGYAEWAPGQLNEEIERGDWYVAPALATDAMAPGPADLWSDVLKRQPMPLPLFSTFPRDLDDN